jgi:hypothetical protein
MKKRGANDRVIVRESYLPKQCGYFNCEGKHQDLLDKLYDIIEMRKKKETLFRSMIEHYYNPQANITLKLHSDLCVEHNTETVKYIQSGTESLAQLERAMDEVIIFCASSD